MEFKWGVFVVVLFINVIKVGVFVVKIVQLWIGIDGVFFYIYKRGKINKK